MTDTKPINYPPQGTFKGGNFMTPSPLGFWKGSINGRTVYIELSEGRGFSDQPIFGVTFRYAGDIELWRKDAGGKDPSQMFENKAQAIDFIEAGESVWFDRMPKASKPE